MKEKLFILDTNVLLSDPFAITKLGNHNDVFIPYMVIEELDKAKKGTDELSRNARAANREILEITKNRTSDDMARRRKFKNCYAINENSCLVFDGINRRTLEKMGNTHLSGDNQILMSVLDEIESQFNLNTDERYDEVILVSKDINLRIKALALNIKTQDYHNDMVILEDNSLPNGLHEIELKCLESNYCNQHKIILHTFENPVNYPRQILINEFIKTKDNIYQVIEISEAGFLITHQVENYQLSDNKVWGINAKNEEQNLALNLLLNPNIHLVNLLGPAGTGKTLITIAAALQMILEEGLYKEAIFTRATVDASSDIGFLPGTEEEKLSPWMGAVFDSLEELGIEDSEGSANEQITKKIKLRSINFVRGRSFNNRIIIIDEFQNLSKKEAKLLLTRAGRNSKVICMGNLAQIDTPYLDSFSSGLTHILENLKDWSKGGHVTLNKTIRSELAEIAEKNL